MLVVLVPARNEGTSPVTGRAQIVETLDSLVRQTTIPDKVVVIADNCTDDTVDLVRSYPTETSVDLEVIETVANNYKKAGGLNQWLDQYLPLLREDDLVMVMDADSALNVDFLENALKYIEKGYHAVGGVFLGKKGGGFVGMLQRNEYARYARDVRRNHGKTLVLTGTATVFTAKVLKDVIEGRRCGRIPGGSDGSSPQVYDVRSLTEDNELTFAIQHLGYKIIAPAECGLKTEVMCTWPDLWKQRYRWKRGAVENNWTYGFTRYTAKHWGLQIWGILGMLVTTAYIFSVAYMLAFGGVGLYPLWIGVTVIFMIERAVTVRARGAWQMILSAVLIVEMPYDICLQLCQARAIAGAALRSKQTW